ncbi:uncharacterized protein LOC124136982 [Haliotis rufescens]|uniref:uncharacterized protein LOC124136982 n=1 Tax=Haliotis rufescens TaxID=6454 RepID=UPI00201F28B7|nr:uncharacterized protein LOC124136982 [Haliotis rufescens]
MASAVLGLLLGCLAMSSAQVPEEQYAVLCQNNFNDEWKYAAPGSGCKRIINCYGQDYHGMLQCPETTLFNENTQRCEYPLDFNCQVALNENPDCVTGVAPNNCSAFTYCYLNTQYNFSCNQDLYYSQSKLTCVYAEDLTEDDKLRCNFRNGQ